MTDKQWEETLVWDGKNLKPAPTTEQLAREWAEEYQNDWPRFTPGTHAAELVEKAKAAAEYILEHTAPKTMADVHWDDEEHHLAGATTPSGIEVVMLWLNTGINHIATDHGLYARAMLTPNGKRYELREITEPDHPEVLETVEDYENAPEGTIIARPGCLPWTKDDGLWRSPIRRESSEDLALCWTPPFNVLRWGGEA